MDGYGITATLKAGKDYSDPWVVIHAVDETDLETRIDLLSDKLLEKVVGLAAVLQAANTLAMGTVTAPQHPPEPRPAQQRAQTRWASTGTPQEGAVASTYPQQTRQPGQAPQIDEPHPENKLCPACGDVVTFKRTQGGKPKWQCSQWRWNQGNPNGHFSEFI